MSTPRPAANGSPEAFFLALRRMRVPLIVLILIFSISVLGLVLIPGTSPDGTWSMGFFDAFYFMSYTATTIGYGEIPQAFNDAQRMWVTFSIYLTVIGWAYAIGTLLSLIQDRPFREAVAAQRFRRRVRRQSEPFWLMAGHGQTGETLGHWLDDLGRRFVVVDAAEERIDVLDLNTYTADVPGRVGDARDPGVLTEAGLLSPRCEGVLALTDDDEANLAITMTASVLRPDVPVIARASSPEIAERMSAFGTPIVINPFDRFGDHFGVALRAPATEQLADWLTRAPGAPLPDRLRSHPRGAWIVCGYGRFGREMTRDLRRDGFDITVVDADPVVSPHSARVDDGVRVIVREATDPGVLDLAGIDEAAGFVAATSNDITNLSLVNAARRLNPGLFVVARQNQPANGVLFSATAIDLLMVPAAVVAREALAHIGTPLMWSFLRELSQRDEAWSSALLDRVVERVGDLSPELWTVGLTDDDAPAVARRLREHPVHVGDLLRDPQEREQPLEVVLLMVARGSELELAPDDGFALEAGDELLLAGLGRARRSMEATLEFDVSAAYVIDDEVVASSWVWRKLTGSRRR